MRERVRRTVRQPGKRPGDSRLPSVSQNVVRHRAVRHLRKAAAVKTRKQRPGIAIAEISLMPCGPIQTGQNRLGDTARAIAATGDPQRVIFRVIGRSEEHTSELQSLMRISYAVFCLKKKKKTKNS